MSASPELFRLGGYREYAPPRELRPFVVALWSYELPYGSEPIPGMGHRLVPDTDLSVALFSRLDRAGQFAEARVVVRGPISKVEFFAPSPGDRIDAVRLRPEWCRDLLGIDPAEHVDGRNAIALPLNLDRITENPDAALKVLVNAFRARAATFTPSRDAIVASGALARMRRTGASFAAIAREYAISERQLRRIVRSAAGFGPKYVQRLARLQRAVIAADTMPQPDWPGIALDAGFYDQPHMIEQYQSLAGCTPMELYRERRLQ